jgi:hypothetical protein
MVETEKIYSLAENIQKSVREGKLEQSVPLLEEFLDIEGADRRWGLSMLQDVIKRMRQSGDYSDIEQDLLGQEQAIRNELLSMNQDNEAWMHRWERARQLNNRAWTDYEKAKTLEQYRAALKCAEHSLDFWPYFLPHLDTMVRCLLALGRKEDAFKNVRWVDLMQPDWPDFSDIRSDQEYLRWLDSHQAESVELPEGPATLDEKIVTIKPEACSKPDEPLNEEERNLLYAVRVGRDEWHRARNSALISAILDGDLPFSELLKMGPQQADLTRGVYSSAKGDLRIDPDTLGKLRHWLIYGSTNHPLVHLPNPPLGIRVRLFVGWDLEEMQPKDVQKLLAEIGKRVGIQKLSVKRCRPRPVGNYEVVKGLVRKPRS